MAFFAPVFEAARVFLAGVDSLSAASFFFRAVARLVVLPAEPFFADEAFEEALLRVVLPFSSTAASSWALSEAFFFAAFSVLVVSLATKLYLPGSCGTRPTVVCLLLGIATARSSR